MISHGDSTTTTGFLAATAPTTPSTASDTTSNPKAEWIERQDEGTNTGADVGLFITDAIKTTAGFTGTFAATAVVTSRSVIIVGGFKLDTNATAYVTLSNGATAQVTAPTADGGSVQVYATISTGAQAVTQVDETRTFDLYLLAEGISVTTSVSAPTTTVETVVTLTNVQVTAEVTAPTVVYETVHALTSAEAIAEVTAPTANAASNINATISTGAEAIADVTAPTVQYGVTHNLTNAQAIAEVTAPTISYETVHNLTNAQVVAEVTAPSVVYGASVTPVSAEVPTETTTPTVSYESVVTPVGVEATAQTQAPTVDTGGADQNAYPTGAQAVAQVDTNTTFDIDLLAQGIQVTTAVTAPTVDLGGDANAYPTGAYVTVEATAPTVDNGADINANVTGAQVTAEVNDNGFVASTDFVLTNAQAIAEAGAVTALAGDTVANVTGAQATAEVTAPSTQYDAVATLTGAQAVAEAQAVSVIADAIVTLFGAEAATETGAVVESIDAVIGSAEAATEVGAPAFYWEGRIVLTGVEAIAQRGFPTANNGSAPATTKRKKVKVLDNIGDLAVKQLSSRHRNRIGA